MVVDVESAETAEMVKIFENTYRLVNISLVNELKVLCHRMGIDVWSVVKAAATKPFGFQSFKPGPGTGGHCLPVDPFYLTWKARQVDTATRFIELAGEVNAEMPRYVAERVAGALNEHSKAVSGSNLLVLGVAYKADVNDLRESPAIKVIENLHRMGAQLEYHDPRIPEVDYHGLKIHSVQLTSDRIKAVDAVLVLTDHTDVDYPKVAELAKIVVDTRCVEALRSMGTGRYYTA
jgi:UDP-N-acetyl-D-glucosamine dehydrogenase